MKIFAIERLASWRETCARILFVVSVESSWRLGYVSMTNADNTAENKPAYRTKSMQVGDQKTIYWSTYEYQKGIYVFFSIPDSVLIVLVIHIHQLRPSFPIWFDLYLYRGCISTLWSIETSNKHELWQKTKQELITAERTVRGLVSTSLTLSSYC